MLIVMTFELFEHVIPVKGGST